MTSIKIALDGNILILKILEFKTYLKVIQKNLSMLWFSQNQFLAEWNTMETQTYKMH